MTTFYKFDNEQQFRALANPEVPVDVIGLIQSGEATVTNEAGEEETVPVYIEGFHVNTLHPVEGWDEYKVAVNSPVRIFG